VTRTAKLHQIARSQLTWIKDGFFLMFSCPHGRNVFSSGAMTAFTSDPRDHVVELKRRTLYGGRRVAGKTEARFSATDLIAEGVFQRLRHLFRMAESKIQCLYVIEEADPTLVIGALMLK
jgi:hypothetical protein